MKNWKSTLSFFIFVGIYIYSIATQADPKVVDTAGYVALFSSLFMMFRSNMSTELISKAIDAVGRSK